MTKMQTAKLSGLWEFYGAVANKCPAIYVLTSWEEMKHAYISNGTWEERVTALYYSAERGSMENCEFTCTNWTAGGGEDYSFSNDGELDAIANELRAVLGHTNF